MTTPPQQTRSRLPLLIVLAAALVVVALIALMIPRGEETEALPVPATTSPVPAASARPSASTASPSPSVSASPLPASPSPAAGPATLGTATPDCTDPAAGFVPTRFAIPAVGADERVVSLNLDEEGNIAAPPKDEPRTASWWNAGPMPGADAGKALLSIHTYRTGKALGNELYADGEPQLKAGDLIKLYGDDGVVQCYEFSSSTKVWVADYDPDSDVMVDFDGAPQLAIIICWDYNRSSGAWDSRIFFYGTPVSASA
ncbi:MAG TPA: class F sortase [Arachnia sp.]|nr:class F sortase [Arachnia sp.]